MRGNSKAVWRVTASAILFCALSPSTIAIAQSLGTWSLPEPTRAPARPTQQGPVDGQNPVVRQNTPATVIDPVPVPKATSTPLPTSRPTTTATASPTPQPIHPTPSASASPTTLPARPSTPPTDRQNPAQTTPTAQTSQPSLPPTAPAEPLVPAVTPKPEADSNPEIAGITQTPSANAVGQGNDVLPSGQESWPFLWLLLPLTLIMAAIAFVVWKRKSTSATTSEHEALAPAQELPLQAVPDTEPARTAVETANKAKATFQAAPPSPAITTTSETVPATTSDTLPNSLSANIAFEPLNLRLSLVYATLQFRLTLTAGQAIPAGHIMGDMIGAHGSLSPEDQLAPTLETLNRLKSTPALSAGETSVLTGEVQLPLQAIQAVHQANTALFIPLVRLCIQLENDAPALRRVYSVGPQGPNGGLSPLRLDIGPGEHRHLSTREIEVARNFTGASRSA